MKFLKKLFTFSFKTKIIINRKFLIYQSNNLKNCQIKKGVAVNKNSTFQNVSIDYGTYLSVNARVSNTMIGKFCSIGPNFLCGFGIHPTNGLSTSPSFYSTAKQNGFTYSTTDKIEETKIIKIGNDVFIGANVCVLDGVIIGDGAIIGTGAIVSKNIPPYAIAVGCPIKIIRYRFEPDVIEKLLLIKWWNGTTDTLEKVEKYFFDIEGFLNEATCANNLNNGEI